MLLFAQGLQILDGTVFLDGGRRQRRQKTTKPGHGFLPPPRCLTSPLPTSVCGTSPWFQQCSSESQSLSKAPVICLSGFLPVSPTSDQDDPDVLLHPADSPSISQHICSIAVSFVSASPACSFVIHRFFVVLRAEIDDQCTPTLLEGSGLKEQLLPS